MDLPACRVTVKTCSCWWLHVQMFPCCSAPPNNVLDKSQMEREEDPVWAAGSMHTSVHMGIRRYQVKDTEVPCRCCRLWIEIW